MRPASFFAELRRRRVVRVAVGYALVAFAVSEAADVLMPALNLPGWTVTLVVALLALGFPLALVLAWAFQVTPAGVVRDGAVETPPVEPVAALATVEATGPTARAASAARGAASDGRPATHPSVAVLPFADMSAEGDQEYFGDGIAEEITDGLTKLRELRVAARTSAFAYKGRSLDVREIGAALGVASVLEGSVRKSGTRLRITAQLISVEDGYHLWSERYDRELDDVFEIQEGIARAVVEALRVELLGDPDGLVRPTTSHAGAYDLYLKGRHAWRRRYQVGLEAALEFFQRAVALDPDFAEPYAGITDTYAVLAIYLFGDPEDLRRKGDEAVARALGLGPDVPDVRFSAGLHALVFDWDVAAARRHFREAIRLAGRHPRARAWLGLTLASEGRREEAYEESLGAHREAPDSAYITGVHGFVCTAARRFEEARAHLASARELEPTDLLSRYGLALLETDQGNHARALELMRYVYERAPSPTFAGLLTGALDRVGHADEARRLLEDTVSRCAAPAAALVEFAAFGWGGRTDAALDALARATALRSPGLLASLWFRYLDPLRADPRWSVLDPFFEE